MYEHRITLITIKPQKSSPAGELCLEYYWVSFRALFSRYLQRLFSRPWTTCTCICTWCWCFTCFRFRWRNFWGCVFLCNLTTANHECG